MSDDEPVYLRPVRDADLAQLTARHNDPAYNSEYNTFGFQNAGVLRTEFEKNGLLDPRGGTLLVVERSSDDVVGSVGYHQTPYGPNPGSQVYNIGITIGPEHRGRGYGTAAQRLLAAYLFDNFVIMRVEASTDVANIAEQRALEKAGFTREGVARKAQWRAGEWRDLVVYSKLRGE